MKAKTIKSTFTIYLLSSIFFIPKTNAQIIYSDVNPDTTVTSTYNLDLNNDGIVDFIYSHISTTGVGYCGALENYSSNISPQNNNAILNNSSYPTVNSINTIIGSNSLVWSNSSSQILYHHSEICVNICCAFNPGYPCCHQSQYFHFSSSNSGAWQGVSDKFLALKLVVGNYTYYGWARMNSSGGSTTLIDYAYNSNPNQTILAGETSCSTPTVTLSASGPLSFCTGDSVELTANTTAYKFQWKKDGINISGATKQAYVAKTEGVYKCKVTNSCGSKTSGGKTVSVPCRNNYLTVNGGNTLSNRTIDSVELNKKISQKNISNFQLPDATKQTPGDLDNFILNSMRRHHIPGYAACIIKNGKIAWTKGYGQADIERNIPFTPNTVMPEIASISKIITATAIMQLWEQGYFQLDDAINNFLPFAIINPYFPNSAITFRMILTHTSSLGGGDELIYDFNSGVFTKPGLAEPLGDFLRDYFVAGGSLYNDSISYFNYPPGTEWNYSNYGFALLGYLVEQISGMPFDAYCRQNIFQPLCMNHTGYHFSDVDTNIVARPYFYDADNHKQVEYGLYETAPYPPVQLKTTVIDFSKFLLMNMNNGILDGVRILDSSTVALMRTSEILIDSTYFNLSGGLAWFNFLINGDELWGHPGDDFGLKTLMFYNVTDNTGIIQFVNGEDDATNFDYCGSEDDIFCKLMEVADTISTSSQPDLNCFYALNPCEHSRTYWKNNSSEWALNSVPMKLGTHHFYTQNHLLALLNKPVNGNASIVLAKQLIAAKLNVAQGSELSPVITTINEANNLIGNLNLPVNPRVEFNSAQGIQMLALAATLDLYNHKILNTVNCSGTNHREANEIDEAENEIIPDNTLNIFPNPFSQSATISFLLEQPQNVCLKIFDLNGRLIKTLAFTIFEAGEHQIGFNAENLKAGVYFLKMQSGNTFQVKKLVITE